MAGRPTFDVPAAFFEPIEPDELKRWTPITRYRVRVLW
jgi:hypothetical protein